MEIVAEFKQGDAVPEWLFYVNPSNSEAKLGPFVFAVDCIVVDAFDTYTLITKYQYTPAITIMDSDNISIGASSKNISIPISFQMFLI